jgi:twitching motility protein PilT
MDYKKVLDDLIQTVINEGASDLHLSDGRNPIIRVSGILIPLLKKDVLNKESILAFLDILLNEENKKIFLEKKEIDFAYSDKQRDLRFRGNGFMRQGLVSIALRVISSNIKTIEELNLPPILNDFTKKQQGFFLVVGPTGHGKSTTLAAMIELINRDRMEHIITIEDPIEYVFKPKKSMIDQREIRQDTDSFPSALTSVFRQDVDVLMIGEMREPETISTAVTAAETGHFVLSTLHTNNAAQSIDRIIDSFPSQQQAQIRIQLAGSLTGIFSQRLIPRISGGLVPACELLISNNAVSNLIREKRTHEINTVIETGFHDGMIDMNRSLAALVSAGEITIENAYLYSNNPKTLEKML